MGFRSTSWAACVSALAFVLAGTGTSRAEPLIINGDFEAGLSGWTVLNQPGSDGTFALQSGTASPLSGMPVPAPPGGSSAAMSDSVGGSGSHLLFQDFVVPSGVVTATLSFDLFVGNRVPDPFQAFFTPDSLDFVRAGMNPANQQARVDILTATTDDPFSVPASAAVLQNVFQTNVGDPRISGYTTYTIDLTSLLASHPDETLRLRFAEVDNLSFFQLGVAQVSLEVSTGAVPEPSGLVLFGIGSLSLLGWRWLRRTQATA